MTVIKHLCLSFALLLWTAHALASDRNITPITTLVNECERVLSQQQPTLAQMIQAAQKEQNKLRETLPARTFIDPLVDQTRVEQFDAFGPQALRDLNPPQMAFQALQAPFSEGPAVIRMDSPDKSIVLRKVTNFNGEKIITSVYASLPLRLKATDSKARKAPIKRSFLIGPEYKDTGVIFWMHGGGTPTATGVNAMSVGLEVGKRRVPVIAIDLPGHGNSSIYPFKSGKEMSEYLISVMKDLVHPDVSIIPMGHSWGGQVAIQMYLLWPKLDTKNLNIAGFLSLAPPADMSLGGCSAQRAAADKAVEDNYRSYKDRIAPSDYDFIENTVRNGKTAPVAGMMCSISAVDYSWRLPEAGEPARPRLMVMVGENDGLVYTGREAAFKKFLTQLVGPENLLILPAGRTFKGDNVPTGHNVFDRYLDAAGRDELREFLADEAKKENIAEVYLRIAHFVATQTGNQLPKMRAEEETDTSINGLIDRAYRNYANNLAFRQFVNAYVYRDFQATAKSAALRARRLVLEKYLSAEEEARDTAAKEEKAKLLTAVNQLTKTWGMRSIVLAKKELPIIRTEARTLELRHFIDHALPIKKQILESNPDTTSEQIRNLPSRPADIDSLEQALIEAAKPGLDKKRSRELDTFILNARTIVNQYQKLLGAKISLEIDSKLKTPEGIKSISDAQWELELDISQQRKNHILAYLAEVAKTEKAVTLTTAQTPNATPLPEGVTSYAEAAREADKIRAIETARYVPESEDPEAHKVARNAAGFIKRMEDTALSINQTNSKIKEVVAQVATLKKKRIDERKKVDEALKSAVPPLLAELIMASEEAQEAYEVANLQVETAQKVRASTELAQMITTRDEALQAYESLKQQVQTASQGIHPEILQLLTIREKTLLNYMKANRKYDSFVSQSLTSAYDRNALTNEHVQQLFAEVRTPAESYKRARGNFLRASHRFDEIVLKLAQEGQLGSETEKLVNQLLGKDGIEHQLQQAIHNRDDLFNIHASLQAEQNALRKKYNEIVPGYYEYREQDLSSLLNLSYDDLIERLEDPTKGPLAIETLRSALKEFDDMWKGRDAPERKGVEIN